MRDLRVSVTDRCNFRCPYCMPAEIYGEAYEFLPREDILTFEELTRLIGIFAELGITKLRITGGEPLLQKESAALMTTLCDNGFTVLLETSGAHDISMVDARVHRIVDLKCPSSGEYERNLDSNLEHLRPSDEVKFVIGTREDYQWASEQLQKINGLCEALFSWVNPLMTDQQHDELKPVPSGQTPLTRQELAEAIITDRLPVCFQLQQHKHIWPPEQKGV